MAAMPSGTRGATMVDSDGARARATGPAAGDLLPLRGPAHRERIDPQGGLPDADRHALAFLAAGADAGIELQIVPDHRDAGEHIRAVANERGALDGRAEPAVLDQVALAHREHELARGDVHLPAAEVHGVDAAIDGTDDFLGYVRSSQHVGVGHARHRDVCEGFPASVAGGCHAHEPGVEAILQVTAQDPVLDQPGALRRRAFIVNVERATAARERAVIHYGAARAGDALAQAPAEGRSALAVEIAFEPVADRLVQQDAGPAGPEHHGHRAGRCVHGLEIHQCLAHRLACQFQGPILAHQFGQRVAATSAGVSLLTAPVLLGDHRHVHAHQRPYVGRQRAVAGGDEHDFVYRMHAGHHAHDARVHAAGLAIDALEPGHLLFVGEAPQPVHRLIELVAVDAPPGLHRTGPAANSDGARGARRFLERLRLDFIGIGEAGAFAGQRAHTHALLDARAPFLDDAILERPGLFLRDLEIQISGVHLGTEHEIERLAA